MSLDDNRPSSRATWKLAPTALTKFTKRGIAALALNGLGASAVMRGLSGLCGQKLILLAYHRILNIERGRQFEFDPELVSATVDDFRWQMTHVAKQYTPITFRILIDTIEGRRTLPRRPIIVTFDDGYDDNYYHAFPILKSLGIPATFFVATGYIGQSHTFWFDWIAYLCARAAGNVAKLQIGKRWYSLDSGGSQFATTEHVLNALYSVPDEERRRAIEEFEITQNATQPPQGFPDSLPMNWDQLREMAREGMEIGSHTVSHPNLTFLSDDALWHELKVSKDSIEIELGCSVDVLSYPGGRFDSRTVALARRAGYRLGTSYADGVNSLDDLEEFGIRRLHVERYVGRQEFAAMLAMPAIFAAKQTSTEQQVDHQRATDDRSQILSAVAGLDYSKGPMAICQQLYDSLPVETYDYVARLLTRNPSLWEILLPAELHSGTALVLENRMGTITLCLAQRFYQVLCVPVSRLDHDIAEQRLKQLHVANVTLLPPLSESGLNLPDIELSAVFLLGLSQFALGERNPNADDWLRQILDATAIRLRDDAVLAVADNNRDNYQNWFRALSGAGRACTPSFSQMGRLLRQQAFNSYANYVSRESQSPDIRVLQEFVNLSATDCCAPLGSNVTKERLLNSVALRRYWPAFLMIAKRGVRPTVIERLLRDREIAERAGWSSREVPSVKRIIAGNADTTIVIAGPGKDTNRDVVVRLPNTVVGRGLCENNAIALRDVAGLLGTLVPRLLVAADLDGRAYFVETRGAGTELLYGSPPTEHSLRSAWSALLSFHLGGATRRTITEELYESVIGSSFTDFDPYCNHLLSRRLREINSCLRRSLVRRPVIVAMTHGDFKLSNLLFDRNGSLATIIDWDTYCREGIPVLDHLMLLTYMLVKDSGMSFSEIFINVILPWHVRHWAGGQVDNAVDTLGLDDAQFRALRIASWFVILRDRWDLRNKVSLGHSSSNMGGVLNAIEQYFEKAA